MARQSLSPMRDFSNIETLDATMPERVIRKRKDAPITHLKYLRKRSGYTLETLSEITSISISYLSRLESGSRRLNTDLIKRLSHAFDCDPSELLQEVSHDNRTVAPLDFNKRKVVPYRENGILLYCITQDEDDVSKLTIKTCLPTEWKQRPAELESHEEVFAVKAEGHFAPHFSASSTIYLEPTTNLTPESSVVIFNNGKILLKKIWSVTPTSLQLCDIADIEKLKDGKISQSSLIEIDRNTLQQTYKVVGYSDFNL